MRPYKFNGFSEATGTIPNSWSEKLLFYGGRGAELNKHITTTTYEELKHRDANFKRIDCSQSQRGIE